MRLSDWWQSLLFAPLAIGGTIWLFQARTKGQHEVEEAICRSDLQAIHAMEIEHYKATGQWAPSIAALRAARPAPDPVMAQWEEIALLPDDNFVARVRCTIDGEEFLFEKERNDKRVRRR